MGEGTGIRESCAGSGVVSRELIPGSRNTGIPGIFPIPGLSSPNPGIFGIKLCRISALFSPHLAALANPFDC